MLGELADRVVGVFSPKRQAERVQARVVARKVTAYAAGKPLPGGKEWIASNRGPNGELAPALSYLRRRSRELVRDNPFAARALAIRVAHEVGYGITPRSNTGDGPTDDRVIALWNEFAARSDVAGNLDFYGQQAQAARCRSEAGEVLVRLVRVPLPKARRLGLVVPLQIEVIEPDLLYETPPMTGEALRVVSGIEFDGDGRRVAYRLMRSHPGEALPILDVGGRPYDRLPASDVLHVYRRHQSRPGQVRGVPDLAPVMMRLRLLDEYEMAAVEQAKVQALLGVFYETPAPMEFDAGGDAGGLAGDVPQPGEYPTELWPGMVGNLPPGASAKFLQPSGAGAFDPFSAHTLRAISVGLGIPFDMLTGDLSQANYSSLRAGRLPFRRLIEQDQELMHIQQMCKPVWAAFIDAAILSGALPERPGGYPVEWNPPGFDLVDPTKDVAASIAAVRAGFATWQQTVASMGYDPRKQADDIAEANDFFDERGLVLDIDPRRTAGTGGAQDARQNAAVEIAATGAVTPRQPAED